MPTAIPLDVADDARGRRAALLIATERYEHPQWSALNARADAEGLAAVLADPRVGGFEAGLLIDPPAQQLRRALAGFFADRQPDDVLLVHLACHGEKDADGALHLAAVDTHFDHVAATGIPALLVRDLMTRSRARRIVLLVDCCFGAAFLTHGTARSGGGAIDYGQAFGGHGRAVLCAASSTQVAREDEGAGSLFTRAVTAGLASGDADVDGDGWVSVTDLHSYVELDLARRKAPQTPTLGVMNIEGRLVIAARPTDGAGALPTTLALAASSPLMPPRREAVVALAGLLDGADPALARSARVALHRLAADDSKSVSAAAAKALGRGEVAGLPGGRSSRGAAEDELEGLHVGELPRSDASLTRAEVPVERLVEAIDACQRSVSTDETRPTLVGITMRFDPRTLVLVATDSYRLTRCEIPHDGEEAFDAVGAPVAALRALRDALVRAGTERVRIAVSGGQVAFAFGTQRVWCYAHDPFTADVDTLEPDPSTPVIMLERRALLDVALRIKARPRGRSIVRVRLKAGVAYVLADGQTRGKAVGRLRPDDAREMTVGLNAEYMVDALESLLGDEVALVVTDPNQPLVLRQANVAELRHLIMPIRLEAYEAALGGAVKPAD